ncbi:MAG: P-loop NTPase fold protein [Thermomicrobiales bacterium]
MRLTANFPNVIYLVAFDRNRVEAALSDSGLSGRDYLEKIIQLPVDIPSVPAVALHNQIMEALNHVVDSQGILDNPQQFASRRWDTSYQKVIRPLIRNMRDLRRYSASLPGTLQQLEGKVSLIDVFTIEAVRIFRPDVFAAIADHQDALGYESEEFFVRDLNKEKRKLQIAEFRKSDKSLNSITGDLLDVLFPAAVSISEDSELGGSSIQEWIRDRRVATRPVLAFYLERVAGTILKAQWIAEQLPEILGDSGGFEALMGTVEADLWPDVFFSLPTFEDRIPQEVTVQAACNLINFASRSLDG